MKGIATNLATNLVATALLLAVAGTASADIGFAAAVDLCRARVPQGTLLGVELRERNGALGYEGDMYDAALATNWGPRFDAATGTFIRLDVDSPDESDIATLEAIFARLGEVVLDFGDAESAANAESGMSDVQKIAFDLEAGILAYQVEYMDGVTKVYVDSVTGGVIPHHGAGDDIEATVPTATLQSAIDLAQASLGAGWNAFKVESDQEDLGAVVQVLLFNLKTGMLAAADVVGGAVASTTEFSPAGGQVGKVADMQANWATVATGLSAALGFAEAEYPGCGVNDVELEIETEKTGTTVSWRIALVTADLIELDYFVDATVPAGAGFRVATAPVNFRKGDINADGLVNAVDVLEILAAWGGVNPPMDFDASGQVDAADLATVLINWG